MQNFAQPRIRYRGHPVPMAQVALGKFYKRFTTSDPWVTYGPPENLTFQSPYTRLEKTQDQINPGPPYRTGGPFSKIDVSLYPNEFWLAMEDHPSRSAVNIGDGNGTVYHRYNGAIAPIWDCDPQFANYVSDTAIKTNVYTGSTYQPDASSWSCKVDKALRPKLEKAGLSVAIAEAREIPQMLRQTGETFHDIWKGIGGHKTNPLQAPKKASEDFLNYQFGWLPFIKDINDVLNVTIFSKQYIDELEARNNRWDHREATLSETETTTTLLNEPTGWRIQPPNSIKTRALCDAQSAGNIGHFVLDEVVKTRVWCTGDFKFYRPEFDTSLLDHYSSWNKVKQYLILYGARINPSVLYKITPWTWLIDWFSNVGDTIESITAAGQDGVVSQNLYTMFQRQKILRFIQGVFWHTGFQSYVFERPQVSKQRLVTGNPFGFCLPATLSSKQLTILAALGLSKRSLVSTH